MVQLIYLYAPRRFEFSLLNHYRSAGNSDYLFLRYIRSISFGHVEYSGDRKSHSEMVVIEPMLTTKNMDCVTIQLKRRGEGCMPRSCTPIGFMKAASDIMKEQRSEYVLLRGYDTLNLRYPTDDWYEKKQCIPLQHDPHSLFSYYSMEPPSEGRTSEFVTISVDMVKRKATITWESGHTTEFCNLPEEIYCVARLSVEILWNRTHNEIRGWTIDPPLRAQELFLCM